VWRPVGVLELERVTLEALELEPFAVRFLPLYARGLPVLRVRLVSASSASSSSLELVCRHCGCDDVVGPFEMDGVVRGQYVPAGAWWIVCRACGGSTLAHETPGLFALEPLEGDASSASSSCEVLSLFGRDA
jgi:hypothetical protein